MTYFEREVSKQGILKLVDTLKWIQSLGISYPGLHDRIEEALSAEKRNCDRYLDSDEAFDAWRKSAENGEHPSIFSEWAYEPSGERFSERPPCTEP